MTHIEHVFRIANWFFKHMSTKFATGVTEHGGKLYRKPVLKMLRDEIIDAAVYFEVLEKQHEDALAELSPVISAIEFNDIYDYPSAKPDHKKLCQAITRAYNILKFGNPEGEIEEDK